MAAPPSLELFTTLVREFTFRDSAAHQTYVYRLYPELRTEQPLLRATFFDIRYDAGRSALLCQRKRQVRAQSLSGALNTTKKSEWSTTEQFFVKRPDQTLVPVKLNNRSVMAALGEQHKASLTAYVSKEQLNLRRGQRGPLAGLLRRLAASTKYVPVHPSELWLRLVRQTTFPAPRHVQQPRLPQPRLATARR